jgi:hypothetical protein
MNTYKINLSKLLNSAVLTLFLLSSTSAFAAGEEEKPNAPAIQMKAPSNLPSPEQEVAPPAPPHAAPSSSAALSPEEQRLQSLQRQLEIAQLERKIAEEQAATRAAVLLGQQQAAPQPDPLGQLLLGAFRGGRSDARVQRNLDKLGLGGFGSFLGLPPRK